nr:Protein B0379.2 [Haemonchus contortus]
MVVKEPILVHLWVLIIPNFKRLFPNHLDNYLETLENVLETASNFTWGMKKHMAADEAAWKELAKRITLLKTEGYDVRAGTKEAKRRRLASVNQSSLMEKVTKKKKRRADAGDGD